MRRLLLFSPAERTPHRGRCRVRQKPVGAATVVGRWRRPPQNVPETSEARRGTATHPGWSNPRAGPVLIELFRLDQLTFVVALHAQDEPAKHLRGRVRLVQLFSRAS